MQRVPVEDVAAIAVHRALAAAEVGAVLARPICQDRSAVTFVVTARHRPADIDAAVGALVAAWPRRLVPRR